MNDIEFTSVSVLLTLPFLLIVAFITHELKEKRYDDNPPEQRAKKLMKELKNCDPNEIYVDDYGTEENRRNFYYKDYKFTADWFLTHPTCNIKIPHQRQKEAYYFIKKKYYENYYNNDMVHNMREEVNDDQI